MGLFDNKSDYERGYEDSVSKDNSSLGTLLDDLATDLNPFCPEGYREGYQDGSKNRD
jgi:hypothetical protein